MKNLIQRIEVLEGTNGPELPSIIMFRVADPEDRDQIITIEAGGHILAREPEEPEDAFEARAIAVFKQRTKDAAQQCLTLIADCGQFNAAAPRSEGKKRALEISAPWLDVKQVRSRN